MVTGQTFELTEDEAELYDRQIRLWGLDSQNRYIHLTVYKVITRFFRGILTFVLIVRSNKFCFLYCCLDSENPEFL